MTVIVDAKQDRRNATQLYNPVTLKDFAVLEGHPNSWVEYVDTLILGNTVTGDEVRTNWRLIPATRALSLTTYI